MLLGNVMVKEIDEIKVQLNKNDHILNSMTHDLVDLIHSKERTKQQQKFDLSSDFLKKNSTVLDV